MSSGQTPQHLSQLLGVCFAAAGPEFKALSLLSRCSTIELHPKPCWLEVLDFIYQWWGAVEFFLKNEKVHMIQMYLYTQKFPSLCLIRRLSCTLRNPQCYNRHGLTSPPVNFLPEIDGACHRAGRWLFKVNYNPIQGLLVWDVVTKWFSCDS